MLNTLLINKDRNKKLRNDIIYRTSLIIIMKNFGLKIGFHVSISGSIINAIINAEDLNCTAFQIFSRNPRGWNAKPLRGEDIQSFKKMIDEVILIKDLLSFICLIFLI